MADCFFPDAALKAELLGSGDTSRKVRARGGSLMLVEVSFETGAEGYAHEHPHEQISYCLEGEFDYTVDGVTRRLAPGDSVYVAGGLRHGTRCLSRGRLLDTFTPQREDFLGK